MLNCSIVLDVELLFNALNETGLVLNQFYKVLQWVQLLVAYLLHDVLDESYHALDQFHKVFLQ